MNRVKTFNRPHDMNHQATLEAAPVIILLPRVSCDSECNMSAKKNGNTGIHPTAEHSMDTALDS
jgi:hypothetical protein